MNDYEKTKREEMLAMYQNLTNDIRSKKNQHWFIVYYCSLVYAGVIGFIKSIGIPNVSDLFCLMLLSLDTAALGSAIYLIVRIQCNLKEYRKRIYSFEQMFYSYRDAKYSPFFPSEKDYEKSLKFFYQYGYWILFIFSLIIGYVLSFYYFVNQFCLSNVFRSLISILINLSFEG